MGFSGGYIRPLEHLEFLERYEVHGIMNGTGFGFLVSPDDLLDQRMTDDVPLAEMDKGDLLEGGEDLHRVDDARPVRLWEGRSG